MGIFRKATTRRFSSLSATHLGIRGPDGAGSSRGQWDPGRTPTLVPDAGRNDLHQKGRQVGGGSAAILWPVGWRLSSRSSPGRCAFARPPKANCEPGCGLLRFGCGKRGPQVGPNFERWSPASMTMGNSRSHSPMHRRERAGRSWHICRRRGIGSSEPFKTPRANWEWLKGTSKNPIF